MKITYSDLFELGYEAIGELKSDLTMVTDWQEPYRQGVVYYLQQGRYVACFCGMCGTNSMRLEN